MAKGIPEWESELWSQLGSGDGTTCPSYDKCLIRQEGGHCMSDSHQNTKKLCQMLDEDDAVSCRSDWEVIDCLDCLKYRSLGPIMQLVTKLAMKYHANMEVHHPPVPADLICVGSDDKPIEVRQVPLKTYHGAIWRLSDAWVIQLKGDDTLARQRFTRYHEIFHVLAHCRGTPVFKKTGDEDCSFNFNEILADLFALHTLLPPHWVRREWPYLEDVSHLANVFGVPNIAALIALKMQGLI